MVHSLEQSVRKADGEGERESYGRGGYKRVRGEEDVAGCCGEKNADEGELKGDPAVEDPAVALGSREMVDVRVHLVDCLGDGTEGSDCREASGG